MKKLLLVTALSAFTILNATSAFAQEVPATTKASGKSVQTNGEGGEQVAFFNEEELKEIHYQMIDNMMKEITETSKTKNRVKRKVVSDTGWQTNTARSGQELTNDARFDLWGAYRTNEMHFVTRFKIYSQKAEIISTSTVGTTSFWPGSYSSRDTSIIKNNARTVSSHAQFVTTTTSQWGEVSSRTYNFTTTITVKYAGNGTITYTARTIVER